MTRQYTQHSLSANNYQTSGPMRLQCQKIKNLGYFPIYIFSVEEDLSLSPAQMMAFPLIVIDPGFEIDLTVNPYLSIPYPVGAYHPDISVTIHGDGDLSVSVESEDDCKEWYHNPYHPWNGNPLPSGNFTARHTSHPVTPPGPAPAGIIANQFRNAIREAVVTIRTPILEECTCPSLELFRKGCTCGHLVKRHWGI